MKVKFLSDHNLRHKPAVVQAFKAGDVADLPEATAETLIAQGVAQKMTGRKRAAANQDNIETET